MSFDWDSIKVVNNPDLKEIEALFTPISSLGGIESPDENGGGTDDGGGDPGVIIDCTPPEIPSKCLQNCDAMATSWSVGGVDNMGILLGDDNNYYSNGSQYQGSNNRWHASMDYGDTLPGVTPTFEDGAANVAGGTRNWTSNFTKVSDALSPCDRVRDGRETWSFTSNGRGQRLRFFASPWYGPESGTSTGVTGSTTAPAGATAYAGPVTTDLNMSVFIWYDPASSAIDEDTNIEWVDFGNPNFWKVDGGDMNPYVSMRRYLYYPRTGKLEWTSGGLYEGETQLAPNLRGWFTFSIKHEFEFSLPGGDSLWSAVATQTVTLPDGTGDTFVFDKPPTGSSVSGVTNIHLNKDGPNGADVNICFNSVTGGTMFAMAHGNNLTEAQKNTFSQTFTGYRLEGDSECDEVLNWVKPEGCPDCSLPCFCDGFTLEPLECFPGEITGGLYEMEDTRPITDGVFLNYDGSQGRVQEWLKGEPSNLLPDVNGRAEVFYNNEKHYGFMDLNGAQQRHWTDGTNYEGQPFDTEFFDTLEFCALIGHTGNQALADPPLIEVPDKRTGNFGQENGSIRFNVGPYLLDADDENVLTGTGGSFAVERSSPSTIRYQQGNISGGYDYIIVDVPPEVLDPNDKYMWLSAKLTFGVESLGPADETIPLYDNPNYWGFRTFLKADIYVNGYLVAADVYCNTNAGYGPDDPRKYIQVFCGQDADGNEIEPVDLKFGNPQTGNGGVSAITVPSLYIVKPSLGSNEIFVAFMDIGAGAADLPNTAFGKNLRRIDPNYDPSTECSNLTLPDGCSQVICPEPPGDGCPCYCLPFDDDPLACFPGVITGGLYDGDYPFPDDAGIYPNYDGSKGRTAFYELGEKRTQQMGENFMGDFQLTSGTGEFYKAWSPRSTAYDPYRFGHVDPTRDVTGIPAPTIGNPFEEEYEFAVLVGHVDNYLSTDRRLIVPSVPTRTNGGIRFNLRGKIENDAHDIGAEAAQVLLDMRRHGPSTIRYEEYVPLSGAEERFVTLPASVLDPEDKTCWFSAKVRVSIRSEGLSRDFDINGQTTGITSPYYWVYSMDSRADLYVNGFLIASNVRVRTKGSPYLDEERDYTTIRCPFEEEPTEYYLRGHQNPSTFVSNDTYPTLTLSLPYSGSGRPVGLFFDQGPGAANLPNTEFGKNLQRVDPNHVGPEECNNCGVTPIAWDDSFEIGEEFTLEVEFTGEVDSNFAVIASVGGSSSQDQGFLNLSKTNSNTFVMNTNNDGTYDGSNATFQYKQVDYPEARRPINGQRNVFTIVRQGKYISTWLNGVRYYDDAPAGVATYTDSFGTYFPEQAPGSPNSTLSIAEWPNGTRIGGFPDNTGMTVHRARYTPRMVYHWDKRVITPYSDALYPDLDV